MYLDEIPQNKAGALQWTGKKMDPTVFEKVCRCCISLPVPSSRSHPSSLPEVYAYCSFVEQMSAEQVGQLYEVMHATKDVWKSPEELQREGNEE